MYSQLFSESKVMKFAYLVKPAANKLKSIESFDDEEQRHNCEALISEYYLAW